VYNNKKGVRMAAFGVANMVAIGDAPRAPWMQRVGAFTGLPALVRELGADPASTLASVGLAERALERPDNVIPYAALTRLLGEAAARTRCEHFGLLAGRMWSLADLGVVGDLTRYSRTVSEALDTLAVHQHLNSGGGLAFTMVRSGAVDLGYAIFHPGVGRADQMYDAVLAASFNFMRELCGPGWLPSAVLLSHARPADTEPYRRLFKVQPTFNYEFSALRFSARWLRRPVDSFDAQRREIAFERIQQASDDLLVEQVFRTLRMLLLYGKSSGDEVASMLSMHRRTLNRRLKAHGTTFQHVLDQVRFDVARQLLADSDIALDDVAATLGYASVSPFMRTFRRWAGTTPARWRRAAASGHFPNAASVRDARPYAA
jgi:AraC-like DNA-binding protein